MTKRKTLQERIAIAADKCQMAFNENPSKWAWCCHHEVRIEKLIETVAERISYILSDKPEKEQVRRLNNFRPVLSTLPEKFVAEYRAPWLMDYKKAEKKYQRQLSILHRKDVPNHTWKRGSIFGK